MCLFVLHKLCCHRDVGSKEKLHYLALPNIENIFIHFDAVPC